MVTNKRTRVVSLGKTKKQKSTKISKIIPRLQQCALHWRPPKHVLGPRKDDVNYCDLFFRFLHAYSTWETNASILNPPPFWHGRMCRGSHSISPFPLKTFDSCERTPLPRFLIVTPHLNYSTHQYTIHWMPVITQFWMNLNLS
jgi:hypothetical protein